MIRFCYLLLEEERELKHINNGSLQCRCNFSELVLSISIGILNFFLTKRRQLARKKKGEGGGGVEGESRKTKMFHLHPPLSVH